AVRVLRAAMEALAPAAVLPGVDMAVGHGLLVEPAVRRAVLGAGAIGRLREPVDPGDGEVAAPPGDLRVLVTGLVLSAVAASLALDHADAAGDLVAEDPFHTGGLAVLFNTRHALRTGLLPAARLLPPREGKLAARGAVHVGTGVVLAGAAGVVGAAQ